MRPKPRDDWILARGGASCGTGLGWVFRHVGPQLCLIRFEALKSPLKAVHDPAVAKRADPERGWLDLRARAVFADFVDE